MIQFSRSVLAAFMFACLTPLAALAGTWVSVDALKQAGDTIIIDARSAKDYAAGHLPGAVNAPWQSLADMSGKPGDPGWGVTLAADQLAAAIGALGISNDSRVVVYSATPSGWGEDGRVAWALRQAGLDEISILDGGIEAWKESGGEISTEVAIPKPASFSVTALDTALTAAKEEVRAALGKARILDARAPEEYAGAQKYGEARGGHLPGAINVPWTEVFDAKGRVLDPAELASRMKKAGITPQDEIIAYCTAGIRSAHLVLALREAGFTHARNYDASFHEWAGDASLPLE